MFTQTHGLASNRQVVVCNAKDQNTSEQMSDVNNGVAVSGQPLGQSTYQPGFAQVSGSDDAADMLGRPLGQPSAVGDVYSNNAQETQQWPLNTQDLPSMFANNWPLPSRSTDSHYYRSGDERNSSTSSQDIARNSQNFPPMFTANNLPPPPPHRLHPSAGNTRLSNPAIARVQAADATFPPPPPPHPQQQQQQPTLSFSRDPTGHILLACIHATPPPSQAHRQAYLAGSVEDLFRRNDQGPRHPFRHPHGHLRSVERASLALQGFLDDRDRALASNSDVENVPPTAGFERRARGSVGQGLGLAIASEWDDDEDEEMMVED